MPVYGIQWIRIDCRLCGCWGLFIFRCQGAFSFFSKCKENLRQDESSLSLSLSVGLSVCLSVSLSLSLSIYIYIYIYIYIWGPILKKLLDYRNFFTFSFSFTFWLLLFQISIIYVICIISMDSKKNLISIFIVVVSISASQLICFWFFSPIMNFVYYWISILVSYFWLSISLKSITGYCQYSINYWKRSHHSNKYREIYFYIGCFVLKKGDFRIFLYGILFSLQWIVCNWNCFNHYLSADAFLNLQEWCLLMVSITIFHPYIRYYHCRKLTKNTMYTFYWLLR